MRTMEEIIDQIKFLKPRIKTDMEVAELLRIPPRTLAVAKFRGSIPFVEIIEFCDREGVSFDWLVRKIENEETDGRMRWNLDRIRKSDFFFLTEDLSYLVELIQRAYHQADPSFNVTSTWVVKLAQAFILVARNISFEQKESLFSLSIRKKSPFSGYIHFFTTRWPLSKKVQASINIETFLKLAEDSIPTLEKKETIPVYIADNVASCFSFLVRFPDNISIPPDTLHAVKKLLEPWCYWVATKSFGKQPPSGLLPEILSSLETDKTYQKISGPVSLDLHLNPDQREFIAGIYLERIVIGCSIHDINTLLQMKKQISEHDFYLEKNGWMITRRKDTGASLRVRDISYNMNDKEMGDLLDLITKIENSEEVKKAIQREIVETYGAL